MFAPLSSSGLCQSRQSCGREDGDRQSTSTLVSAGAWLTEECRRPLSGGEFARLMKAMTFNHARMRETCFITMVFSLFTTWR